MASHGLRRILKQPSLASSVMLCYFASGFSFRNKHQKEDWSAFDQQIDELFPNSPLFKLKEVTESDVRLWQRKFYSSLASATKPQSENPGGGVLPYMGYIGMCGPEGYGFLAVLLVINWVSILAIWPPFWS